MHREKLKEREREAPTSNGRARARSARARAHPRLSRLAGLQLGIFERPGGNFGIIFGALCGHVFERSRRILPREPEEKSIETLPAQTARRARAAGELGHKRSYGLAVSTLARLSPLSPCSSMWFWRSLSCCSSCSRCSRLACNTSRSSVSRASRSMIARFSQNSAPVCMPVGFSQKRVPQCRLPSGRPPGSHLGAILGAILAPFWDPRRAPGAPGEPKEAPNEPQETQNDPQEGPGGQK